MMKGLKSLFVVEDETKSKSVEVEPKNEAQFDKTFSPSPSPSPSPTPSQAWIAPPQVVYAPTEDCSEDVEKLRKLYNDGFAALNKDGYDFFEIYQVLKGMGTTDVNAVRMAVTMGKTMNPSLTSESLAQDADYYIEEINKNHQSFVSQGESGLLKIEADKLQLSSDMAESLRSKQDQVNQLIGEITELNTSISSLDSTFANDIKNIKCRMMANDIVKNELINSLTDIKSKL